MKIYNLKEGIFILNGNDLSDSGLLTILIKR